MSSCILPYFRYLCHRKAAVSCFPSLCGIARNHFSPVLRGEDNMVPAQPFRMCRILFFCHKKTPSRQDGSLKGSLLPKRCFFRQPHWGSTRPAGDFLFRSLPLPQRPEGFKGQSRAGGPALFTPLTSRKERRHPFFAPVSSEIRRYPGRSTLFPSASAAYRHRNSMYRRASAYEKPCRGCR